MKKTCLIFGLTSGAVAVGILLATLPYIHSKDIWKADVLGYTSMVASALLVFFGMRSYRENVGGGRLTIRRGFVVGLLITLISAACYTATFEMLYFQLMPDLGEKYAACMVERARLADAGQEKIAQSVQQAERFKQLYDRPVTNAALTFGAASAIGLICSVVSAAILRRKGATHEN